LTAPGLDSPAAGPAADEPDCAGPAVGGEAASREPAGRVPAGREAAGEVTSRGFLVGRGLAGAQWRGLAGAAFAAAGVVLFLAYLRQAQTELVASDGASQVLQAWDMLHGNVLLRGWSLSDVTFYTTELPQYMLIELVRGMSGQVVHIAAAMTYTLLVLGVGWLAKGDATGREGLVRMLVAAGILLAPPLGTRSTSWIVLNYPDHTGTQVPLLLIWLALDRLRPRWWLPVLISVALVLVQLADTLALYEGAVPVVIVCAVRIITRRDGLRARWYELSLGAGALASVPVATLVLKLIRQAGGFDFSPPGTSFASIGQMTTTFWPKLQNELILFGANFFGEPLIKAVVPLLHLVGVLLVVWAAVVAVRKFAAEDSLMIQVVTATFVAVLAAYTFGPRLGAWEAIGLLPTGAVLAGRLLAGRIRAGGLVVPLAVVLLCYAGLLGHDASAPQPASFNQKLATWLEVHHLRYGLARYWHASAVTVDSRGQVAVRPIDTANDEILLTHWNSQASWYDPRRHDAQFVIWPARNRGSLRSLRGALGNPDKTYLVDGYAIMVWDTNLLNGPFASGRHVRWNIFAQGRAGPIRRY
jgi:hypothetical protein